MKTTSPRRTFLKQSAALGGGLLLLGSEAHTSRAASTETKPAGSGAPVANETLRTIQNLRTIHGNFLDKPLPEGAIETILQASVRAANASNMQSYSIVVVKDRAKMKEVCTYQGSCLLVYCVDFNRVKASAAHLGYTYFPDNLTAFVTASINTTMALQTAAIAARSLGIDYLITNGIHRGDPERVFSALDLPERNCLPLIALLLGYADKPATGRKGRLSEPGIVHHVKYHRLSAAECDAVVAEYDDPARHLGLIEDWREKGSAHYLEWLFTKWARPFDTATEPPSAMSATLNRHGFIHAATNK